MTKLLIIDDEPNVLYALEKGLKATGQTIVTAATGQLGLAAVTKHHPDVVLLDVQLPDLSGIEVLKKLQQIDSRLPVIIMTAHGTADTAIEAMKQGAYDYILKPWKLEELKALIDNALQASRLSRVPAVYEQQTDLPEDKIDRIVGNSSAMQHIFKEIGKIAQQDVNVLILGESGTGKELVARAIYHHSKRKEQPFLAINCAALPDTLLESELFGHEKGAFTGADRRRVGKFEQADKGTLFLDELGDMALVTQAKVLRILQDGRFERIGGNETLQTDVRIIAATNKDLAGAIQRKEFRQDLYYRLNTFILKLPSLRERPEDIPFLIDHFIARQRQELGLKLLGVSPEAMQLLQRYPWPGNVRELENAIKYAMVHAHGEWITPDSLPDQLRSTEPVAVTNKPVGDAGLPDLDQLVSQWLQESRPRLLDEVHDVVDRLLLTKVLAHAGGQQTRAAALLGISRNTLRTRLQQLGLSLDKIVRDDQDDEAGRPG
ncbi:MAG TPA: sigma-54 dependent transcriptional regulator [Gemmatales bacterium]|nr:sigma-54 dependent transcriptional regulator [Gemmatales bacterium]